MKKLDSVTTTTYDIGNGFMVDIVDLPKLFEAWLYHKDYGTKTMIIGSSKTYENASGFLGLVERVIEDEDRDYIASYREEVMDPDDHDPTDDHPAGYWNGNS